jgi:hypothetical protein
MLGLALRLATDMLGSTPAGAGKVARAQDALVAGLARSVEQRLGAAIRAHDPEADSLLSTFDIRLRETSARPGFVLAALFTPNADDAMALELPTWLAWGQYAVRPIRLASKYLRRIGRQA